MVNNGNNTISEISAKKGLNTLNEIKNAEIIKYKKRTPGHKELLNLFNDLLDIILTDKTLESESQEDKNENENDKTLMSSKDENENDNDDENENESEKNKTLISSEDADEIIKILMYSNEYAETMNQNEKKYNNQKIK